MPSTPSTRIRFEQQAAGENLNTWGAPKLNSAMMRMEEAIDGRFSKVLTTNYTLATANYTADEARMAFLDFTGAPSSPCTVTVPAVEKTYLVRNATSGDLVISTGSGTTALLHTGTTAVVAVDGTNVRTISATADDVAVSLASAKSYTDAAVIATGNLTLSAVRGQLAGLVLSTAGSSAVFGIGSGSCVDSTQAAVMSLSSYTKTTAAWAVGSGNGGLDTGAIANSTWYHVYLIMRPDTAVVDVLFSTSATSPTLPTYYTLFRRIGSMKTDGSAHWTAFQQYGDTFWWVTTVLDVNTTPTSGTQNAVTLSVPTGVNVEAIIRATAGYASGTGSTLKVYPTFSNGGQNTASILAGATSTAAELRVVTNTSAQVDTTFTYGGSTSYELETLAWVDRRGRDA